MLTSPGGTLRPTVSARRWAIGREITVNLRNVANEYKCGGRGRKFCGRWRRFAAAFLCTNLRQVLEVWLPGLGRPDRTNRHDPPRVGRGGTMGLRPPEIGRGGCREQRCQEV